MLRSENGFISINKILIFSGIMYFSSLCFPAFYFEHHKPSFGYEVLLGGWMGILVLEPRWYANIFYIFVIDNAYGNYRTNKEPSVYFATVLVISTLLFPINAYFIESSSTPVEALGLGAYLWCASILTAIFAYTLVPFNEK